MIDVTALTTFLGWCAVLNLALIAISALVIVIFNAQVRSVHSKLFPLESRALNALYFSFLGRYKLMILVFNLVPYWALKIMAA
ncbi:hypothetical protein TOI97_06055 [Denitrificimonas sp. JX-1]|uniref:DUF6868 domain-containing protein n=1 Tax=Denitrificimonas halotolerans TaxID=3098930 RepID=A0ABU5GQ90_9GAMM|nr:hypothetical protein [Denitrificimonas sp. JX-1]MDY7219131.1 hypothetical protein [Denitrificimonas sp. JX-1]